MKMMLKRLWKEEEGQDLIEYALLVAVIAMAAVAVFPAVATAIDTTFNNAVTCLGAATATGCGA